MAKPNPKVKERRIDEARREYLRRRCEAAGGQTEFARLTQIERPGITRALAGRGGVTDNMLSRIAATVGPTLDEIYEQIAALYAKAEAAA